MAVNAVPDNGRLVIELETTGTDGRTVIRNKNFANLKPVATEADVYAVGQALGALQQKPVAGIRRINEAKLIESV